MKAIWKYKLTITDEQTITMPPEAKVLSAHEQDGELCIWALVTPATAKSARTFLVIGTGNPCPPLTNCDFIGTVLMPNGLVWHVFEKGT